MLVYSLMAGLDGVTPVVPALLTPEAAKRLLVISQRSGMRHRFDSRNNDVVWRCGKSCQG